MTRRLSLAALVATGLSALVFVPGIAFLVFLMGGVFVLAPLDSMGLLDVGDGREGFFVPNKAGWTVLVGLIWTFVFLIAYGALPRDSLSGHSSSRAPKSRGVRINGLSIASFRRTYDELLASLTPEEREALHLKLLRLHAIAVSVQPEGSQAVPQDFSAQHLRDRLHDLDYERILALYEH